MDGLSGINYNEEANGMKELLSQAWYAPGSYT